MTHGRDEFVLHALSALLLGHITTDKKMPLLGLGPYPGPGERHDASLFVSVPRCKVADQVAAPRAAHLVADGVAVVRVHKLCSVAADHPGGVTPENAHPARANPQPPALPVPH